MMRLLKERPPNDRTRRWCRQCRAITEHEYVGIGLPLLFHEDEVRANMKDLERIERLERLADGTTFEAEADTARRIIQKVKERIGKRLEQIPACAPFGWRCECGCDWEPGGER